MPTITTKDIDLTSRISRRQFLVAAGITATTVWLAPRRLFADEESPVTTIRGAERDHRIVEGG